MKTFYEELIERGILAKVLTLELAWSLPFICQIDSSIGTDIITYRPVVINLN